MDAVSSRIRSNGGMDLGPLPLAAWIEGERPLCSLWGAQLASAIWLVDKVASVGLCGRACAHMPEALASIPSTWKNKQTNNPLGSTYSHAPGRAMPFLRKWRYEFSHSLTPVKLKMGLLTLFLDFMDDIMVRDFNPHTWGQRQKDHEFKAIFSYIGGESGEQQLCADFPELDLSQLDTSDFDSAACFGELQWCPETSETEPSQYSPDDAELFQIDSENEALLAALTKTLDDIPEDDVGLAAFPGLDEGDTPSCVPASPDPLSAPPSPALERLLSPVSEVDELSL
ncbi:hypothetical protein STEG23_022914, partial [Scotinomys teguina]